MSHSDTPACRRSYGRPASGEATRSGGRLNVRASSQIREYVDDTTTLPRRP
ncbi:hypothetical protein ACFQ0D_01745 [Micromonospora zhanjiangensis]